MIQVMECRSFLYFTTMLEAGNESLEIHLLNELEYHFSVTIRITETKLANSDLSELCIFTRLRI